jgi:hypothetical protein
MHSQIFPVQLFYLYIYASTEIFELEYCYYPKGINLK